MKLSYLCALAGFAFLNLCSTQRAHAQWVASNTSNTTTNVDPNGGGFTISGGKTSVVEARSSQYPNRITGNTAVTFDNAVTWAGAPQASYPSYTQQYTASLSGHAGSGDYAKSGTTVISSPPYYDSTLGGSNYSKDYPGSATSYNQAGTFAWTLTGHVEVYTSSNANAVTTDILTF